MEPILETTHLAKIFQPGTSAEVAAVDNINFSVLPGEIVLVMGPSGSGKTTFLSLIAGLLEPTAGTIILAGHHLEQLSQADRTRLRRQHVGFIFQSFQLLSHLTAYENVLVGGFTKGANHRARQLLDELGFHDRYRNLPKELSGGERQRVAIARALMNEPTILLADEPTANLDRTSGQQVMELFRAVAAKKGKAVVIVTHDDRLLPLADRIVHIEDGKIS